MITFFFVICEIIIGSFEGNLEENTPTYIFVYLNGVLIRTSLIFIIVGSGIDISKIELMKNRRKITGFVFMLSCLT